MSEKILTYEENFERLGKNGFKEAVRANYDPD